MVRFPSRHRIFFVVLSLMLCISCGDNEESNSSSDISVSKEDLFSSAHNYNGWSTIIYVSKNYEEIYDYVSIPEKPLIRYYFREDGTFERIVNDCTSIAWNSVLNAYERKTMFYDMTSRKRDLRVTSGSYFLSGEGIKLVYMGVEEVMPIRWKDSFKDKLIIDGIEFISQREAEPSTY